MVASKKTPTSSSANNRPKRTANIPKPAKENATAQATTRPPATKKTTASTRLEPRPAAKPLQAHIPSSQVAKDVEIAALLAKVAAQKAAIDKLKKSQASKPVEKKLKEIKRPLKITNLQAAMGLDNDKRSYLHCLATVRDVAAHAGLTVTGDWRNRDAVSVAKVAEVAKSRNVQLGYYEGNWATYEILKRFFKGKRYYAKRITSMDENKTGDSEGDNDGDEEGNNLVDGINDDEVVGRKGVSDADEDDDGDGEVDENKKYSGDMSGEGESDGGGDRDDSGEGIGDDIDNDSGEGNGNGDNIDDDEDDIGEFKSDGENREWDGKGKGKAKEATRSAKTKRSMPQSGRKSNKKARL